MAQIQEVRLIDDLDGEAADETVEFGLDGKSYAVDLSTGHAEQLREILQDYINAGRRTGGHAKRGHADKPAVSRAQEQAENAKIREWAREHDMTVSDRGRIPLPVLQAYREAA